MKTLILAVVLFVSAGASAADIQGAWKPTNYVLADGSEFDTFYWIEGWARPELLAALREVCVPGTSFQPTGDRRARHPRSRCAPRP